MPIRITCLLAIAWIAAPAQVLTFARQALPTKKAALWEVTIDPCATKPIPVATLRRVATDHGLQPWSPSSANLAFAQRSLVGRLTVGGQVVTSIAAGIINVGFITASTGVKDGINLASAVGQIATVLGKANPITTVPNADQGIAIGPAGCTVAYMYTAPTSNVGFNTALP